MKSHTHAHTTHIHYAQGNLIPHSDSTKCETRYTWPQTQPTRVPIKKKIKLFQEHNHMPYTYILITQIHIGIHCTTISNSTTKHVLIQI